MLKRHILFFLLIAIVGAGLPSASIANNLALTPIEQNKNSRLGEIDKDTGFAYGIGIDRSTFRVGEPIYIYVDFRNESNLRISSHHSRAKVLITTSEGRYDLHNFGFDLRGQVASGSFFHDMFMVAPHSDGITALTVNSDGNKEQPGSYRVRVDLNLLKSVDDPTVLKAMPSQTIDFVVTP